MKLQKEEQGTIKDLCYRRFERGFTNDEIVKEMGFKKSTVKWYRIKRETLIDEIEFKQQKRLVNFTYLPDHKNEMDYGLQNPIYRLEDLSSQERGMLVKRNHKNLKKLG
jgi:hypothetical protein